MNTDTATLDLFANPAQRSARTLARTRDPETSRAAAEKAVDTFVAGHEAKCFGAICDAGERGATYKEIAASTGLDGVAVARRLGGMGERRLIQRKYGNGQLIKREGCAVWVKR